METPFKTRGLLFVCRDHVPRAASSFAGSKTRSSAWHVVTTYKKAAQDNILGGTMNQAGCCSIVAPSSAVSCLGTSSRLSGCSAC